MNVLTIIDSFKGTITSKKLGEIVKEELEAKGHNVDIIPVADGGDGFCDAMEDIFISQNVKYKKVTLDVMDPLFRKISSYYLVDVKEKTAYIELAKASGINLLDNLELNPLITSTYGFGELINDAIKKKYKKIVLGIGGSATNDAGCGMLEALGVKFYNGNGDLITQINNTDVGTVEYLDDKEFKEKIEGIEFVVLSDVTNPLLGPNGATYVFSPQKGAKAEDLEYLESNIYNFAKLNKTFISHPGSGAAGGVGYALLTYFNAKLYSGIDYILDLIDYDNLVKKYDLIITGEGKIDNQSLDGKVIFRISNRSIDKKVILVCAINKLESIDLKLYNVSAIYSIVNDNVTIEESIANPEYYFRQMVRNINL